MIPRFAYARPTDLAAAFAAFAAADGDGAYIAGGTELLQVMKMGFAQFGHLVDLKGIDVLRGITASAAGLRIGALTTHREIERSPEIGSAFPGLAQLERSVANVRVRSTGTIGGNLCFAEPHSDPATLLLAVDARVELARPNGSRDLPIGDFVLGPLFTAREADEILTAVLVPPAGPGVGRSYGKLAFFERPAASVGVRIAIDGGIVSDARVAVGSLTDVPELVPGAGAAFAGVAVDDEAALTAAIGSACDALDELDPVEDLNGSADYKRHLAGVLLDSTARAAIAEAVAGA